MSDGPTLPVILKIDGCQCNIYGHIRLDPTFPIILRCHDNPVQTNRHKRLARTGNRDKRSLPWVFYRDCRIVKRIIARCGTCHFDPQKRCKKATEQ